MTESYERYLPQSKADDLNGQKSSKHDSSIHPDCIPGHRAAGKTPQFYPCGFSAKTQQACRDGRSDCPESGTPSVLNHESGAP